jgi:thiol-disulfide isomerase/thioredoxin
VRRRLGGGAAASTEIAGSAPDPALSAATDGEPIRIEQRVEEVPKRVDRKREQYPRAIELRTPTGFINVDGLSLGEHVGDRVILIEFWTFGCYNCQNTHPKIQRFWRQYRDDGLLVVGVHYPEFDRERDPANVRQYINETDTTYPVVLDNDGGTWDAYDQRYWPCRYLIGVDGFVRYKHAGEGAYEETERAIQQLLAERNRR